MHPVSPASERHPPHDSHGSGQGSCPHPTHPRVSVPSLISIAVLLHGVIAPLIDGGGVIPFAGCPGDVPLPNILTLESRGGEKVETVPGSPAIDSTECSDGYLTPSLYAEARPAGLRIPSETKDA